MTNSQIAIRYLILGALCTLPFAFLDRRIWKTYVALFLVWVIVVGLIYALCVLCRIDNVE